MTKEQSEARFGVSAIQKGYVTLEQVVDALGVQAEENFSKGQHRRVGQILLEQELIDHAQLDEVLQTLTQK